MDNSFRMNRFIQCKSYRKALVFLLMLSFSGISLFYIKVLIVNDNQHAIIDNGSMINFSIRKPLLPPKANNYLTALFGATCGGGRLANQIYEFISLYGIARSLNRTAYINLDLNCALNSLKKVTSYFPNLSNTFHLKFVEKNDVTVVRFAPKCCTYDDVSNLYAYNSSRFLFISSAYLISFKYFDRFKLDVLKLLEFTDEDIIAADRIANINYSDDSNQESSYKTKWMRENLHSFAGFLNQWMISKKKKLP